MENIGSAAGVAGAASARRGVRGNFGVAARTVYDVECFGRDGHLKWHERCHNRVVTAGLNKLLDATFKTGLASPAWYVGIVGAAITDAAITATDQTLTSASNPFTSGDVGRSIIVQGAGSGGIDLVTTIASYTGAGEVELTDAASTTVSGARALWEARAADTMGSHGSWSESTAYDESVRQTLTPGSISGGSVDNSASKATFTISTDNSHIGGFFLADDDTKSGTSGTLYGMAPFTAGFKRVDDGDELRVTVTLTQTDATG